MWNGEGGQVSSSSDYSSVAEDPIFSSILMPDDCGIRWETQLQMRMKFQTANSSLKVCKNRLKGLYDARDELSDKQTLIQLQIKRAEASQRKAEGSFRTCHYPILPDATNKDIECMLKLDGSSLSAAALFGPLTGPHGPFFDLLTEFTPDFNAPVDYFTTPAGPSTSSARLVSSTAGPVVRAVRPGRPVVRAVPTLLPLRHASLTSAFDAGFRSVEFTTGPNNNNNDNNKPVETIKSLKVKRLLIKPILPSCRKPSKKEFWQSQVVKNAPVLPASGEEDYLDLLASSD